MKIAYFQCASGISGDMTLGALVDAGVDWDEFLSLLAGLRLPGYTLVRKEVRRGGLRATKVDVLVEESPKHRHLSHIEKIINDSFLPEPVKKDSLRVFRLLAEAEAHIHGTTPDEVHFHEVGATDAIVDIVGAALGLWLLGIEKVYSSAVNTGEGQVQCAHGWLPVPAPATLELLKGAPVYSSGIQKELTTPTGAAILAAYCVNFGAMPPLKINRVGYGAGGMELPLPNLLRVIIGEADSPAGHDWALDEGLAIEEACVIEANIDNMNPEFYGHVMDAFFAEGAMDVFLQPIQMKKNRPAVKVSVLIHPRQLSHFTLKLLGETTTLGIRVHQVTKYMLPFEIVPFASSLGQGRVKTARRLGRLVNVAPEYEDCLLLAQKNNMPPKQAFDTIKAEFLQSNPYDREENR